VVAKQQNPSRIQAQTCQNHPPQNSLTSLSDALKKEKADAQPQAKGKPQQDKAQVWKAAPWKWPLRLQEALWGMVAEPLLPELTLDSEALILNNETPAGHTTS